MKPSILLRVIISLVIIAAFVLGATYALASNSLNPTALWWAQRQLPVLWMVDGFALLALLPVFGSAILQTRLSRSAEELAAAREGHEIQMEEMVSHTNETERINLHQAKSVEALEATVATLNARLETLESATQARQESMEGANQALQAALEAANTAHQERMEAEMRRLAVDAFAALANEVQANTRQMDAVSLAMQYQRAEIKQLRQNLRATPRPPEPAEIARLTPYELAALRGEDAPLLLKDGEEEEKTEAQGLEANTEYRIQNTEEDQSAIGNRQSAIPSSLSAPPTPNTQHPTPSVGFFEPTMNAQTTFVSPTTEFEIAPSISETAPAFGRAGDMESSPVAPLEFSAGHAVTEVEAFTDAVVTPQTATSALPEEAQSLSNAAADTNSPIQEMPAADSDVTDSPMAVTLAEYESLHEHREDETLDTAVWTGVESEQLDPQQIESPINSFGRDVEPEEPLPDLPQESEAPRGLRRWFMRH